MLRLFDLACLLLLLSTDTRCDDRGREVLDGLLGDPRLKPLLEYWADRPQDEDEAKDISDLVKSVKLKQKAAATMCDPVDSKASQLIPRLSARSAWT